MRLAKRISFHSNNFFFSVESCYKNISKICNITFIFQKLEKKYMDSEIFKMFNKFIWKKDV